MTIGKWDKERLVNEKICLLLLLFYLQINNAMMPEKTKFSLNQIVFINKFISLEKYKENYLHEQVETVLMGGTHHELDRLQLHYVKAAVKTETAKPGSVTELQDLKIKYKNEYDEKVNQLKKFHDRSMLQSFSCGAIVGCAITTLFFLKK